MFVLLMLFMVQEFRPSGVVSFTSTSGADGEMVDEINAACQWWVTASQVMAYVVVETSVMYKYQAVYSYFYVYS